jgi:hypothetical protein
MTYQTHNCNFNNTVINFTGEKFQYEWSLITHPDGAEKGTMVGKNTDKLTISKVNIVL